AEAGIVNLTETGHWSRMPDGLVYILPEETKIVQSYGLTPDVLKKLEHGGRKVFCGLNRLGCKTLTPLTKELN
ncbi:MAG: hypothetical protein NUV82_02765, partial [Candidatus Komeilibacteria bacterium]|nr:hypothetical protein [Candidatus Komeilibacteria bacterium]